MVGQSGSLSGSQVFHNHGSCQNAKRPFINPTHVPPSKMATTKLRSSNVTQLTGKSDTCGVQEQKNSVNKSLNFAIKIKAISQIRCETWAFGWHRSVLCSFSFRYSHSETVVIFAKYVKKSLIQDLQWTHKRNPTGFDRKCILKSCPVLPVSNCLQNFHVKMLHRKKFWPLQDTVAIRFNRFASTLCGSKGDDVLSK